MLDDGGPSQARQFGVGDLSHAPILSNRPSIVVPPGNSCRPDGEEWLARRRPSALVRPAMGLLKQLFTWWDGATLTTSLSARFRARSVGSDGLGNIYYMSKKGGRRFVIYNGANDPSRIPPDWYAWLHHMIDGPPEESLPPAPKFLREAEPNRTGTPLAYRPSGALELGAQRPAASGDYEAWTPDQA